MLPIQPVTPMIEHINRSAAEADLDRALANDPFLFGLDTTAPEPSPVSPVIDEQQRLAAARAMLQQIETQEGDSPDWPVEPTAGPRHEQARAEAPYTDPLLAPVNERQASTAAITATAASTYHSLRREPLRWRYFPASGSRSRRRLSSAALSSAMRTR